MRIYIFDRTVHAKQTACRAPPDPCHFGQCLPFRKLCGRDPASRLHLHRTVIPENRLAAACFQQAHADLFGDKLQEITLSRHQHDLSIGIQPGTKTPHHGTSQPGGLHLCPLENIDIHGGKHFPQDRHLFPESGRHPPRILLCTKDHTQVYGLLSLCHPQQYIQKSCDGVRVKSRRICHHRHIVVRLSQDTMTVHQNNSAHCALYSSQHQHKEYQRAN